MVLLNLYKDALTTWFKQTLQVALRAALPSGHELPPLIDYGDLQAVPKLSWLGFENYIAVSDRWRHCAVHPRIHGADHASWPHDILDIKVDIWKHAA